MRNTIISILIGSAIFILAGCDRHADRAIEVAKEYMVQDFNSPDQAKFRNDRFYTSVIHGRQIQGYVCGEFNDAEPHNKYKRYIAVVWLNNKSAGDLTWAWYDESSEYREIVQGLDFESMWNDLCKEQSIIYQ